MITNQIQLEAAVRQLNTFHEMLEAMRVHLQETNPSLFPSLSEGYLRHIIQLEKEIIDYAYTLNTETNSAVGMPESNVTESQPVEAR